MNNLQINKCAVLTKEVIFPVVQLSSKIVNRAFVDNGRVKRALLRKYH